MLHSHICHICGTWYWGESSSTIFTGFRSIPYFQTWKLCTSQRNGSANMCLCIKVYVFCGWWDWWIGHEPIHLLWVTETQSKYQINGSLLKAPMVDCLNLIMCVIPRKETLEEGENKLIEMLNKTLGDLDGKNVNNLFFLDMQTHTNV